MEVEMNRLFNLLNQYYEKQKKIKLELEQVERFNRIMLSGEWHPYWIEPPPLYKPIEIYRKEWDKPLISIVKNNAVNFNLHGLYWKYIPEFPFSSLRFH